MQTQRFIAALGFAACASAHMVITHPVPFNNHSITNSPLNADGSDFPCKYTPGNTETYSATEWNEMPLGSTQPLEFMGSAVHGGGSCQISITYDLEPNTESVFKVIHSIEGGCPAKDTAGNLNGLANLPDPFTYSFKIPDNLPTGNATLAWTWFNKIGNREMYMNCAPITLTGSSARRSEIEERDTSAYNALPDMFVANVGNGCGTVDSTDLLFPQPGDSVEQLGLQTSSALAGPTGNCQAVSAAPSSASPSSAAASTTSRGAVFITTPVSSIATAAASSVPASSPAVSSVAAPSPVSVAASSVASSVAPVGTGSSGLQMPGSPCSPEGEFNCIGSTSFQRCASGVWSVSMQMAAGTTCTSGLGQSLNVAAIAHKRAVRFSKAHARHAIPFAH